MREVVLAVDIGGTKTAAALVARESIVSPVHTIPTPGSDGPEAILRAVRELAHQLLTNAVGLRVRAVGIGAAGVVDVTRGTIISATDTLADWAGTAVAADMTAMLEPILAARAPVHVQNDVDAFAFGELQRGAARGADSAILIAVGTGVGASVIIGGHVMRGARGVAGEIGHLPIAGAAHLMCPCGRPGHLEALGSGIGMHRHYLSLGGDASVCSGHALADLAAQGDAIAVHAITDSAAAVGRAVAGAVCVLDPELVVVSGGVVDAGPVWWDPMERALRAELIDVQSDIVLVRGQLGSVAPLYGAAASAWTMVDEGER